MKSSFAKKVGVLMRWNEEVYPIDARNLLFDSVNKTNYDQYKTYSNKSEAFLACLNNPNCPWVFDEKCDGIGPFVISSRAQKMLYCPQSMMDSRKGGPCNDDCLFKKG